MEEVRMGKRVKGRGEGTRKRGNEHSGNSLKMVSNPSSTALPCVLCGRHCG